MPGSGSSCAGALILNQGRAMIGGSCRVRGFGRRAPSSQTVRDEFAENDGSIDAHPHAGGDGVYVSGRPLVGRKHDTDPEVGCPCNERPPGAARAHRDTPPFAAARTSVDGRSPGSRVDARCQPSRFPSGAIDMDLPLTVAGAAADSRIRAFTAFPFDPVAGNHQGARVRGGNGCVNPGVSTRGDVRQSI